MQNMKIAVIAGYLAAAGFFIAFVIGRQTPMLVLGCAWVAISGMFTARLRQK